MTYWAWPVLGISAQAMIWVVCPDRHGKGRFLSRPLYRFFPVEFVRVAQIMALLLTFLTCVYGHLASSHTLHAPYWLIFSSLYLDDYFTGDDDKWRKFWRAVKNKIKWKMKLPQPAPQTR